MKAIANRNNKLNERVTHQNVYAVDSYADGVSFGRTKVGDGGVPGGSHSLKLEDDRDLLRFRKHFSLEKGSSLDALELELMNLSQRGILRESHIILGTTTDPFHPFDRKFDGTMKFLALFQRYTPGLLTVQTRSPLIVLAMPVLTRLGDRTTVTMGVETDDEEAVRKYTPGLPRAEERLKAARALRNFGIKVTLQVAPVLPYGDWRKDAPRFAQELITASDYIKVASLLDGSEESNTRNRSTFVAKGLARDRKFHWLRPDSANPLLTAITVLAPAKLELPVFSTPADKQIKMFAA